MSGMRVTKDHGEGIGVAEDDAVEGREVLVAQVALDDDLVAKISLNHV